MAEERVIFIGAPYILEPFNSEGIFKCITSAQVHEGLEGDRPSWVINYNHGDSFKSDFFKFAQRDELIDFECSPYFPSALEFFRTIRCVAESEMFNYVLLKPEGNGSFFQKKDSRLLGRVDFLFTDPKRVVS